MYIYIRNSLFLFRIETLTTEQSEERIRLLKGLISLSLSLSRLVDDERFFL